MNNTKRTTLNWTNRKKISQNCVQVERLENEPSEPRKISVEIRLPHEYFPESALVVIEAYRFQISKRFECGTVGNLEVPNPLVLEAFSTYSLPNLRLLVVDQSEKSKGRLLGSIKTIKIPGSGNSKNSKKSLLLVDIEPLGNEIWKVDFVSGPRLIIDSDIPNIKDDIEHDPRVFSYIVPSAFRHILNEIVHSHERYETDDLDESWIRDWIDFCKKLGIDEDPREKADEEKMEWVDRCVENFCAKHNFLSVLTNKMKE